MLIKDGRIIGFGKPEEILTGDTLKQAFDVSVEVRRAGAEGTYFSYEKNF
jgi:ABC-type cobalamin/Fe3+-siderophores transport system ATPase subunit